MGWGEYTHFGWIFFDNKYHFQILDSVDLCPVPSTSVECPDTGSVIY